MRFADLLLRLQGSSSGETIVRAAAAASGTVTLPGGTTDFSGTGGASQVVRQSTAGGAFTVSQLAAADVTGALTSSGVSGMTAGQIPVAATATTITSSVPTGTTGNSTVVQTNASGNLVAGVMPAYTGDVTSPAGSSVNTLANTAVTAAAYTHTALTVDGKGRITAAANGTLTGDATLSGNAITLNTVPIAKGGTGATTAGAALTNLGAAPIASPSFTGNATVAGTLTVGGNANPTLIVNSSYTQVYAPDATTAMTHGIFPATTAAGGFIFHRNAVHRFEDAAGATLFAYFDSTGAYKPSGGSWTASSDARLKRDIAGYTSGLAEVRKLSPITYCFNGRGGTVDDGRVYTGLVANDAREAMPELVGTMRAKLDPEDADETELLTLDPSALVYALVNSCKELAARVEALEARLKPS